MRFPPFQCIKEEKMSFTEPIFLFLFFPLLLAGHCLVRRELKNVFLLVSSIIFYALSDYGMLWLLLTIIAANYFLGLVIGAVRGSQNLSKIFFFSAILINFGILFYYKYLLFAVENVNALFQTNITFPSISLPIGISFITFRSVSYCVDVYWGTCKAEKNPLNVALYISFFPQVTMGPITKFNEFQPQLNGRTFSMKNMEDGVKQIIIGLAMKLIFANQLGLVVNEIFLMQYSERTVLAAWIGIIGYLLQLYYDFAGYSHIAIGLGNLFGFRTPENFDYPYMAKSAAEFWNKWHMTLGAWLRDYIYIPVFRACNGRELPLLKKKVSFQFADYIALLAVWTFSGIWHGAAWNFIFFGLYYCFFIILERVGENKAKARRKQLKLKKQPETKLQAVRAHIYTLIVIIFGQLLFRVEGVGDFIPYIKTMFGANGLICNTESIYLWHQICIVFTVGIILAVPILRKCHEMMKIYVITNRLIEFLKPIFYLTILILVMTFVFTDTYQSFIYFQF